MEDTGSQGEGEKEVEVEAGGVFWINGLAGDTCRDTQCKGQCNGGFKQPRKTVKPDRSWISTQRATTTVSNRFEPIQEEETLPDIVKPKITQVGNMWKIDYPKREINYPVNGKITVDSGAADSVMPRYEVGQLFPLLPKKEGVRFCAANGQTIANYGRRNVAFFAEGHSGVNCMTFHVTDVKKTLASVSKMVEKGNEVHFTPKESYIKGFNGEKIPLTLENGVYVMNIEYLTGFSRQV